MQISTGLLWKAYPFLFAWNALGMFSSMFYPDSEIFIFYHIITAFAPGLAHINLLATASAVINLVAVIAVFGFAFNKTCQWPNFWKLMLVLRAGGDLFGRNYEFALFKSALYVNKPAGIAAILFSLLFLLPSYIAHYRWAFRTSCDK